MTEQEKSTIYYGTKSILALCKTIGTIDVNNREYQDRIISIILSVNTAIEILENDMEINK